METLLRSAGVLGALAIPLGLVDFYLLCIQPLGPEFWQVAVGNVVIVAGVLLESSGKS